MSPANSKPRKYLRNALLLFLAATGFGLLTSSIYATSYLAEQEQFRYAEVLLYELTAAYCGALLVPFLLWFMKRFPIRSWNWRKRVPLHLLLTIPLSISWTLMMWGSRSLLFDLFGWGAFNYGWMRYRFVMEYEKQFVLYWGIYALVSLVAYARESRERELQASKLEKQLTEAKLEALRMQLNPHFLFNTLNMISSYVHEDPDIADRMITRLSDLLRLTLNHAGRNQVTLNRELEFLDAYLAIMKARFQERLQVQLEIEPGVRQILVPHLILQPLVENSIKHCTADFAKAGEIRIAAQLSGEFLRLELDDNGPGISGRPRDSTGGGIGLSNTMERLRQLYGDNHRFELANRDEGGLRVILQLPAKTKDTQEVQQT